MRTSESGIQNAISWLPYLTAACRHHVIAKEMQFSAQLGVYYSLLVVH